MQMPSFQPTLRRFCLPPLGAALLLLTSCARHAGENGEMSPAFPALARSWAVMSAPVRALATAGTLFGFAWLIGGVILGYLLFSLNVAAMSAVRWGVLLSVLLWLGFAFWFRWSILLNHNLLPFLLLTAVVLLVSVLFLFLILRAPRNA